MGGWRKANSLYLTGCLQVRRLPPRDVLNGLQQSATYARNVWVRLNGGRVPGGDGAVRLPEGLPVPNSTKVPRPWICSFCILCALHWCCKVLCHIPRRKEERNKETKKQRN